MKNKILFFSIFFLSISVSAQSFKNPRKTILVNSSNGSNLSVNTIKLIKDHNKNHSDDFGLLSVTKAKEVRIFLRLKNNCAFDFSSTFFSSVLDYGNNLYTASVNIDQLEDIKEIDCIEKADVGANLTKLRLSWPELAPSWLRLIPSYKGGWVTRSKTSKT